MAKSAWIEFVSKHYHDKVVLACPVKERFKKLSEMYKKKK